MLTQISFDLPYDMKLQEFLQMLVRHGATMKSFEAVGPAGGNPYVKLSVPTKNVAALRKELEG